MKTPRLLTGWLLGPPLRGKQAALYGVLAVAAPTLIRSGLDDVVTELAFTFYFPFALVSAIVLRPLVAASVAIISALIVDWLFLDPRLSFSFSRSNLIGMTAFLIFSALAILLAAGVRKEFAARSVRTGKGWKGIVFSSNEGEALASWYDGPSQVPLGPETEVAEMMQDFLAQVELGKRLNGDNPQPTEVTNPRSVSSR